MPDEPLIFVEVALVNGMAGNVQALLDEDAPVQDSGTADTAIFYSISNAQKGLAGISFGNFLIKRVVDSLASEFKGLKTFATLSPVPGFGSWLDGALASGDKGLLKSGERKALLAATGRSKGAKGALKELLSHPGWPQDEAVAKALRAPPDAALGPLPDHGASQGGEGEGPGRPFSPVQRRPHGPHQLVGRHLGQGLGALGGDHGQLRL
jgi:malonyl-CoA decarboxylase